MKSIEESPDSTAETFAAPRGFLNGLKDYYASVRLFSPNARLYLFGSFLMGLNFQVFNLLLNLYLKEMGFPEGQIGLVASGRAVGMTIMAIPVAMILSRVRLKPILMATVAVFAGMSVFIVTLEQLELLIGFAILSGMAFAFYRVAGGPFYMRNSTPRERTHLFSLSFGVMIMAGMIGSLTAGQVAAWLAERTGDMVLAYRYTLYGGIGVSLLALIPFMFIKAAPPSAEENRFIFSRERFRKRGKFYLKIASANLLIGTGAGLVIPFLNLYFRDRFDLAPDSIGFYFFLVNFAMLAGTLAGPVLAKRFGLVRTVVFTEIASIPFLLTLSYTYLLPLAVVAFVVRAGLMNLGVPIMTNLAMELSDKDEQGLVNALLMVSWTGSWMVSTALGGRLIQSYGYTVAMNITMVLYVLSSLVFFSFFRHSETRNTDMRGWIIIREGR